MTPAPGLDQFAADPGKVATLPPEAVEALLAQVHVLERALLTRLLAARAQDNGRPEISAAKKEDRWLKPEEAATFLGLTVEQLNRRRNIPRKKLGHRTVRYSLAVLKRHMARA